MLIVALVLAVIGLAALVTAVVTSSQVVAWVCIGASALGVVLLVVDAIRERRVSTAAAAEIATADADLVDSEQTTEFVTYEDQPVAGEPESEQQAEIDAETAEVDAEAGADSADDSAEGIADDVAVEDHPDEVIHEEPEYDTYSDDEQELPASAEEAALHTISDTELDENDPDDTELDGTDPDRR